MNKAKQLGFGLVEIIIALVVLGVIGFLTWRYLFTASGSGQSGYVQWSLEGDKWSPSGTAPECETPLAIGSPTDITKIDSVLMPGQVRGGDFKPHGGLANGSIGTNMNEITITTVRDAYLYRGSRYIQEDQGQQQVQYLFDFIDPCGIMFRFDHLSKLSDEFAAYASKMPEPMLDDSRTTTFDDHPFVAKGAIVATEVGITSTKNAFFDLGVYDLRQPNEASKTDLYKTDALRISDKEQSFFAVCWFNLLPTMEREVVAGLPQRNGSPQGESDYCK